MRRQFLKDAIGWGFLLWLIGYALGIILFMFVPLWMVGWIIMPIGTAITLWVLIKKIKSKSMRYYAALAVSWTILAVVCDYIFLVKAFKPADGYYKLDVYIYYVLIFVLPLLIGKYKRSHERKNS